jgi:hypothetical protein
LYVFGGTKMDIRETRPLKPIVYDEDGNEHELPTKFEVCPACKGKGSTVNPSIDSHGISAEEFYEDPDFAEEYMSGMYDVGCYHCGGKRVIKVPDFDKMTDEEKESWEELQREVEFDRRTRMAEMGLI